MNINPETDLDLEKLFLPAWAQGVSDANRYAKYTGNEGAPRGERGDGDRRGGPRPPRRDAGPGARQDRPGGPRREGGFGRPSRDERGGPPRDDRRGPPERREAPLPLPPISAALIPDERGVQSMARQVKMTGRAFPLFDIAFLILQKPERYSIRLTVEKNAAGQPAQPMFLCALDDTVWLSEEEAVAHVLQKHFPTFYRAERTATEPPKGVYTFVGQCDLSGVVLGPPNHHDYQNQLRKLHTERFSRMPFDVYKSRVKIVRDEAVVKQWVEEQSWKTEYVALNVPEPLTLPNREEVEKHFRVTHKDTIIKAVESQIVSGVACRSLRGGLSRVVMQLLADQRRFPMQIATALSQSFAHSGLHFFKVNKTVTHVAVARPCYLDLDTTPVSEGVRRIVDFINAHPKCNRRKLIEALVPTPAPINPAAATAGEASRTELNAAEPTTEQAAMVGDLHWLVHQGHVIEFANGLLETAKKPAPKPLKPEAKPVTVAPTVVKVTAPVEASVEAPVAAAVVPVSQAVEEVSSGPATETAAPSPASEVI